MSDIEKSKSDWLETFCDDRPDLFFPEAWSDDKKDKAITNLRSETTRGRLFNSIPMVCRGPECIFAETCPLQQEDVAPIGKRCPIEGSIVRQLMSELIEEFSVDQSSINELAMIRDLVNQEVQHIRATNLLAQEDFMQEVFVGVNERTGEVFTKKELHQAVGFEDKLLKRKKELRNQFLATREAKAKAGLGRVDASKVVSDVIHQVEQVRIERERAMREALGMPVVDSYIQDSEAQDITDAEVIEDEE